MTILNQNSKLSNIVCSSANVPFLSATTISPLFSASGIGLGLDSTMIYVKSDDGDNKIEAENKLVGLMFFVSYVY
ncbi:MAG: hypothetical protein U9Q40_05180 [Campylobacterota bacterium]|nr:hypothetical protein [Campylobacterota bacterium]